MTVEFQIDLKHQIKSLKQVFVGLIFIMTGMTIGHFLIANSNLMEMLLIGLIFWLVTSVALVLPFHIQYFITNWGTKLTVDKELKTIKITQSGTTNDLKFSDFKVYRHILGHHKPGRTKSWTPIPFDHYGYIEIITNDNKKLFLTSLMIDPFNFPLTIEKTEYRFPFIKGLE